IQDLGFNYAEMEKDGIISPVLDIQISYKKPLRYGDVAKVNTWIEEYDGFRVTYGYEIFTNEGEIAVTAISKHVCVKRENFRPIAIRKLYPDWHQAYENAKKKS
ncbi:MAG TPA: thioesterase family protein, partial [Pseudoneobacillus sp.]|nr:thioesterase family protein [Pseudoneobacillus sp.]